MLGNGAETKISGEISAFADWNEDVYFFDPSTGAAMPISGMGWYLQFRRDEKQTGADVTLSTVEGSLSIVADDNAVDSILRIAAAPGTFSSYIGNMICDLVGVDGDGETFHYGHGVVTILNDPVTI